MKKCIDEGCHYIQGEWLEHRPDFKVLNPAVYVCYSGECLGFCSFATKEELDKAVAAANEAFAIWGNAAKWSWVKRAEVIDYWVQLIKANKEPIAVLMAKECGKIFNECEADVEEGIHMLQYCAGRGRQPVGHRISSEISSKEAETFLMPKGVCVVITPWNFPLAIPTWLIGPAITSGNTVVFKPSEETPLTAQYLIRLFDEAAKKYNVPVGVINMVHGDGAVGQYLVEHPDTVGQLFTGSYEVGQKIRMIAAGDYRKFAVCEMGGKNSLLVMDDANLKLAVTAATLSAYKTTHQRCVSADLIIVHQKILSEFLAEFLDLSKRIKFGDPFNKNNFAGSLINKKAVNKFNSYYLRADEECDTTLLRGHYNSLNNFVSPNVFLMHYRPGTFVLNEEAFTPNIIVVPVKDFEEALFVANSPRYGLSMALISNDFRKHREFKIRGKAGLKYVNLPTIGAEVHLPFGGMDKSGTGIPSAAWLFNYMCHETAFTVNYGEEIQLAQGLSARV